MAKSKKNDMAREKMKYAKGVTGTDWSDKEWFVDGRLVGFVGIKRNLARDSKVVRSTN